jgi:2',3'-cyclic-nucleotide 2'-phosphodiesterase (5'-nucleotidase family)
LGGLSKKAFQIKSMATEKHQPYLFVDSGNLLFKQPQIPSGPSQEQLTAEGIIKIYAAMQVDAVAVAPLDLASGLALLQTSQKQGFPWLSANLLDQDGHPLFQPVRIKKIGKIKAGIIGLTGAVASLPAGVTLADWRTVLPALIKKTARQCDILILLSSLSPAENQEIAQQFQAIHLILAADLNSGNMNPQQVNNTLITQTDRQGKYQGILTIDWNKNGRWGMAKKEELTNLRNRLGALNWQLQRMQQRKDLQQPEYIDKIALVEKERKTVEQQIKTLEQPSAPGPAGGQAAPCTFSYTFLALQQSMAEAPEIKAIVTNLKQQINDLQHDKRSNKSSLP